MSVLTKVLVVLVTVFSIVLVALVIPFVANQQTYLEKYKDAQAKVAALERMARVQQVQADAVNSTRESELGELRAASNQKTDTINRLLQDLAKQSGDLKAAKADLAQTQADQTRLASANDQLARLLDAIRVELSERRDNMVEMELKIIESADKINELSSQLDTADVSVRRLREELADRDETLKDYEAKIAKLPQDVRGQFLERQEAVAPYMPEIVIDGRIDKIEQMAGDTFVQLDVGRRDQVSQNMKFVVHRGGQFVGTLVVTLVDEDSSVGKVVLRNEAIAMQPGDAVRTGGL